MANLAKAKHTEILDALSAEGVNLPGLAISILERLECEDAERRAVIEYKQRKGVRPGIPTSPEVKRRLEKPKARSGREVRRQAERRGTLIRTGISL